MGTDGYGSFYNMTGNEAIGHCFLCGKAVKGGRRYCNPYHREKYRRAYCWDEAKKYCFLRYAYRCFWCNAGESLEVHHIEPLRGGFRAVSLMNRPENLILLCRGCHLESHAAIRRKESRQGFFPFMEDRVCQAEVLSTE